MQFAKRSWKEVRVEICHVLYRGQGEEMNYGAAEQFTREVKVAVAESKEMEAGWGKFGGGIDW